VFRLETRPEVPRWLSLSSPLFALALTVLAGVCLFVALGKDPLRGLELFFVTPLDGWPALAELSIKATPLILIGIGLSVCFRANVWNIGAEGQFLLGAVCAGGVAIRASADASGAFVALVLLAGLLGGMAWAAVVAVLRDRFGANEILASLMLVYVAEMLLVYLVQGPWRDPQGYNFPQTITFLKPALVPRLVEGYRANAGVILAVLAVPLAWLLLSRTILGFRLQVVGLAPQAARYAGFSSRKTLWLALLISGGLAGLAGALEVAGPVGQLNPHVPVGYGFAAIIVAFVGRLHPLGVAISGVLMSMFYLGGELAQSRLQMPKAVTGVFQGMLLFALLSCDALVRFRLRRITPSVATVRP
jgi:general nucleoside transport system permease protein